MVLIVLRMGVGGGDIGASWLGVAVSGLLEGGLMRRVCSHCRILCGEFASPHADVVSGVEFQLMHGCRWVEIDVVGEGAGFESECHALKYHFLVEVWCAKGSLTKTVNKSPERLVLFLSNA